VKAALVTCSEFPELTADDRLLKASLENLSCETEVLIWSEDRFDSLADIYVIRSIWDYHLHIDRYLAWHRRSFASGRRFVNSASFIEWNLHKKYLLELHSLGLPVIPTEVLKANRDGKEILTSIEDALRVHESVVVKPAISASAFETKVISEQVSVADREWLTKLVVSNDLLLQPFISEIALHGELSLVWIGQSLSHGYLKFPKSGDFRSQEEFGARLAPIELEPWHRQCASRFVHAAKERCGAKSLPEFARIDLLTKDGKNWFLGELELFEPALQLAMEAGAAERLARSILGR
jgi:hypothetical protein